MVSNRTVSEGSATTPNPMAELQVNEFRDGDTIYQQCLLLSGRCRVDKSTDNYITIRTTDNMKMTESLHSWPVNRGEWKALVLLAPGENRIEITFVATDYRSTTSLRLIHQPLLQVPPLHLAILMARDSNLTMDCPEAKLAALSTAHSSLDAAIDKLRTTAYMWQALIAEDMCEEGVGRRTFRLEEEFVPDDALCNVEGAPRMRARPKVHLIRTQKSLAELRRPMWAQQDPRAPEPDGLHGIFIEALKEYGEPFDTSYRPVVAGLILDSSYSHGHDFVVGHAAVANHNRDDLSLGMFGSHLTYSWPRSLDEVTSCLVDNRPARDTVRKGNGKFKTITLSRACSTGQGAFLDQVGRAFGKTQPKEERGWRYRYHPNQKFEDEVEEEEERRKNPPRLYYGAEWATRFLDHDTIARAKDEEKSDQYASPRWTLQELLRINTMPHFRVPGEEPFDRGFVNAKVDIAGDLDDDDNLLLHFTSPAGIVEYNVTNGSRSRSSKVAPNIPQLHKRVTCNVSDLDRAHPLHVSVLAGNGHLLTYKNAWRLLPLISYVQIPGTDFRLRKRSFISAWFEERLQSEPDRSDWMAWTVLLNKPNENGKLIPASSIDIRVEGVIKGVVVYYADGTRAHCGATHWKGNEKVYGSKEAQQKDLLPDAEISQVGINMDHDYLDVPWKIERIRMTLRNGEEWGDCHGWESTKQRMYFLAPPKGERIVGFFGKAFDHPDLEFGIITAPKNFVLPEAVYQMEELENNLARHSNSTGKTNCKCKMYGDKHRTEDDIWYEGFCRYE